MSEPSLKGLLMFSLQFSIVLQCFDVGFITLRAKLSGAVYCNRSCLFARECVCLWVCYNDNSKLRASIFTKLGL